MKQTCLLIFIILLTVSCTKKALSPELYLSNIDQNFSLASSTPSIIRLSKKSDRTDSVPLSNQVLNKENKYYIFIQPLRHIKTVEFKLNNKAAEKESYKPFDLGHTLTNSLAKPINTSLLKHGVNKLMVKINDKKTLNVNFYYGLDSVFEIYHSYSPDRSKAQLLKNATLNPGQKHYIFVKPLVKNVKQIDFFLNGQHMQTERIPPYDLAGTTSFDKALAFNNDLLKAENNLKVVLKGEVNAEQSVRFKMIKRSIDSTAYIIKKYLNNLI